MRVLQTIPTGRYPEGLDISPDGRFAYVSNEGDPGTDKNSDNTVSVVDLQAGRVVDTAEVELGPDGLAFDAATGRLYVCDENGGDVSVVQLPATER
jgi:DNA-binding beta-propeller fold protein YncE